MGKVIVTIDPNVLKNVKSIMNGHSTSNGIEMLGLKNDENNNYNFAGNTYLDALREIRFLMQQLGIEDQLYK